MGWRYSVTQTIDAGKYLIVVLLDRPTAFPNNASVQGCVTYMVRRLVFLALVNVPDLALPIQHLTNHTS